MCPGSFASTSSVKISLTSPMPLMSVTSLPSAAAIPADSCPRCCSAYKPQYVIRAASGCPYTAITPHSSRSLSKGVESSSSSQGTGGAEGTGIREQGTDDQQPQTVNFSDMGC